MTTQGNLSPTSVTYRGPAANTSTGELGLLQLRSRSRAWPGLGVAPGLTVVSLPIQIRAISVVRWLELLSEKFVFIRVH